MANVSNDKNNIVGTAGVTVSDEHQNFETKFQSRKAVRGKSRRKLRVQSSRIRNYFRRTLFFAVCALIINVSFPSAIDAQITTTGTGGQVSTYMSPGTNFSPSPNNYLKNSAAFRQEIMRMEINVVRGTRSLPLTQVPRVQKDDVIKMKLIDEPVGGIRPSESLYDWTFLVAFVNPNRRAVVDGDESKSKGGAVSQEVRFKKTGWYKQYSFQVPYDSQPVFFLYPKPNYRSKILKVVSRNYNEVRKLGDKTIEIAGAYSQISGFLNELQYTLYQTQTSRYYNNNGATGFGSLPNTGNTSTNPYGTTYPYGGYNPYYPTTPTNQQQPDVPFNYNFLIEQSIERMARSFNIQLPSCWGTGSSSYGSTYGSTYGSSPYGSTYGGSSGGSYGSTSPYGSTYGGYGMSNQNNFGYAVSQELFSRAQCVAKNIRIEDFDLSVASMLQQGGIMAAAYLRDKFPQLSYWINLAATAIDFIVKVFQKAALRIVPTIVQASDGGGNSNGYNGNTFQPSYAAQSGYTTNYNSSSGGTGSTYPTSSTNPTGGVSPNGSTSYTPPAPVSAAPAPPPVKLSLYAESQPDNLQFVTAYPIVVHKWQQEPDPEVISLPPPVLAEPCLHAGVNILKNTMIGEEPEADTFTKDFKLTMNGSNGFKKEFPLKKNIGLGGWELNLSKEDLNSFPKVQMTLESVISGTRGFNEIKSPTFILPLSLGGSYEVKPDSQKAFAVGGKRIITLTNPLGGCQCLQAVVYKPSFGGQFVYEANAKGRSNQLQYSPDGRDVSFEIDASSFQPGAGQLILFTYGGEQTQLNLKLYALPPNITNVKMARGDNQAIISGERLEQLQYVKINGRRATVIGNSIQNQSSSPAPNGYPYQPSVPNNAQLSYPNTTTQAYSTPSQPPMPAGYPPATNQPQNGGSQKNYPNQTPTVNQSVAPSAQSQNGYPNPVANVYNNQQLNNSQQPNPPNTYSSVNVSSNERLIVFDEANAKLTEAIITLELGLEDNRTFSSSKTFPSAPSRPAVVTDANREIEAQIIDQAALKSANFDLQPLSNVILPVETSAFSSSLRNALTDYDFALENLSIETRLEKTSSGLGASNALNNGYGNSGYGNTYGTEAIKTTFEVLDWKNLRLDFALSEQVRKTLGGRRIQFRIRDRERGDSDWYTVKQTFIRTPRIESVVCTNEMNGRCEMSGEGIDYIAQISVDGGVNWHQSETRSLQVQTSASGSKVVMIPAFANKKMLMVKLRDYPQADELWIADYTFVNTIKTTTKITKLTNPQSSKKKTEN